MRLLLSLPTFKCTTVLLTIVMMMPITSPGHIYFILEIKLLTPPNLLIFYKVSSKGARVIVVNNSNSLKQIYTCKPPKLTHMIPDTKH